MSTDEGEDPRLSVWVDVVDYYWQRASLGLDDRQRLREELLQDLRSARAGGASVESLAEADPAEFADELARADGLRTKPLRPDPAPTRSAIVVTMLGGAAAGFVAALVLVYPLGIWVMDQTPADDRQQGFIAVGLHALAAVLSTAGALAATWWRFRFRIVAQRTLLLMGASFALGGSVSIAPTMYFARWTGYSSAFPVVAIEITAVVGCCAAGAWLAARFISTPGSQESLT